MKYSTEEERMKAKEEAYERARRKKKLKYEESKERMPSVKEWFTQSQQKLHAAKNV